MIRDWEGLRPGLTVESFLDLLGGPAWIRVPGRDRSRVRVVSTLLHGNEPSGSRAIHRWLRSDPSPAVDVVCFLGSVRAAVTEPRFTHRALPGHRDQNRCFAGPFDDEQGRIARGLLDRLRDVRPEALIDLHNTSGRGPAYAVSTRFDPARKRLCSFFSDRFILTDLRMGALMEAVEDDFPMVTIECGGARDPEADAVAREGLTRFVSEEFACRPGTHDRPVKLLQHPVRVELREGARVTYAAEADPGADVTLPADLDRYNYEVVTPDRPLGWLGPEGLEALTARDGEGRERVPDLFGNDGGRLRVLNPSQLYMITTRADIARSDCLFYVIPGVTPA